MTAKLPYSPQLDHYLNDLPTLLGERSSHGALVSAIERGGPSSYVSDEPYHAAAIGAVGPVKLARDLEAAWRRLGPATRAFLAAHYERRRYFAPGVEAHLGAYSKAALHIASEFGERHILEEACMSATLPSSKATIEDYRTRALDGLEEAHKAWANARKEQAKAWAKTRQSTVEASHDHR